MKIRVSYMRKPMDGFCIVEEFDVDHLPRKGDRVFVPETFLDQLAEREPSLRSAIGVARRYEVVLVEHRWEDICQNPHVQITRLFNPEFGLGAEVKPH